MCIRDRSGDEGSQRAVVERTRAAIGQSQDRRLADDAAIAALGRDKVEEETAVGAAASETKASRRIRVEAAESGRRAAKAAVVEEHAAAGASHTKAPMQAEHFVKTVPHSIAGDRGGYLLRACRRRKQR